MAPDLMFRFFPLFALTNNVTINILCFCKHFFFAKIPRSELLIHRMCGVLVLRDNLAEFSLPNRDIIDTCLTFFFLGRMGIQGIQERTQAWASANLIPDLPVPLTGFVGSDILFLSPGLSSPTCEMRRLDQMLSRYSAFWLSESLIEGHTWGVPSRSIRGTRWSGAYLASRRFMRTSRRSPSVTGGGGRDWDLGHAGGPGDAFVFQSVDGAHRTNCSPRFRQVGSGLTTRENVLSSPSSNGILYLAGWCAPITQRIWTRARQQDTRDVLAAPRRKAWSTTSTSTILWLFNSFPELLSSLFDCRSEFIGSTYSGSSNSS